MGSKSPAQTTTVNSPPPQVLAQYQKVVDQANQVAQTPYQSYGGQLVAGVNGQQNAGISGVNQYANSAQPYYSGAAGLTLAGAGPANAQQFSGQGVGQYMSPYQQQVIDATMAQINNQNAQQQTALQGNAISAGAFGGDRAGIAQAQLGGQQAIAANSTLANLNNQNYSQALGEFNNQQTTQLGAQQANLARLSGAGAQLGSLGTAAQTAGLQGAGAQLQAGGLQQQTSQAQDTAAYNQFLQQQAYPFQTTQWLANISEGIGSNSGGTSTTSSPAPSSAGGIAGGLLSLGSMFLKHGGRVDGRDHYAAGGGTVMPYADAQSWVPGVGALGVGHSMPTGSPGAGGAVGAQQQGLGAAGLQSGLKTFGDAFKNSSLGDHVQDALQDFGDNLGFAHGGVVRPHYADGGDIDPNALMFDPAALGVAPSDLSSPQVPVDAPAAATIAHVPTPKGLGLSHLPDSQVVQFDPSSGNPTSVAPDSAVAAISDATAPRNVRNNNPGNIEDGPFAQGLPGYAGSDGRFARFANQDAGAAAQDHLLASYGAKGFDTPLSIISRWAPAGDGSNNPSAYAGFVAKQLGISPTDKIDMTDPAMRSRLASAMATFEGGGATGGGNVPPPNALAFDNTRSTSDAPMPGVGAASTPTAPTAAQTDDRGPLSQLLGLHLSPQARQSLLAAGLGMMASKSPWAGVQIGEGGLAGLNQYNTATNLARQQGLANASIANTGSEIENRKTLASQGQQNVDIQAKKLDLEIQTIQRQLASSRALAGLPPEGESATPSAPTALPSSGNPKSGISVPQPSVGAASVPSGVIPGSVAAPGSLPQSSSASPQSANTPSIPAPTDNFWQGVDPDENPATLNAKARAAANYGDSKTYQVLQTKAASILSRGTVLKNGQLVPIPGYIGNKAAEAGATATATETAKNATMPSVDPGTGAKYVGGTGAAFQPAIPATNGAPGSFKIDPETAAVSSVIPPAPRGGGYIIPNLPPGAKQIDDAPANKDLRTQDGEFLKDQVSTARSADSIVARTQAIAQAFKTFESGALADKQKAGTTLALALGQPSIAKMITDGNPAGMQWVEKEGVNSVLDTLKAATPRFAQAEFNQVAANGTPNVTNQPQANHEMVSEMLALGQRNRDFMRDWEGAKQQGWASPSAFYTAWNASNPLNGYIKSAQRQIGNFAGMDLPKPEDWAAGSVYIAPKSTASPTYQRISPYLAQHGVKPGDMFRYNGAKSANPVQMIPPSDYFSAHLGQ